MGISGLLPIFKTITKNAHVSDYEGKRAAIDTYSWLHKGAFGCSREICQNLPTRRYIDYCMHRVNLLRHNGVKPIMVFDGGLLPMKASQEAKRRRSRAENLERAYEHEKAGNLSAAHECYQRAVDISPANALELIKVLRQEKVDFIVAPYEADAQLAFLALQGHVHVVITEDSDLIAYGCPRVLFKMDKFGHGSEIEYSQIAENRGLSFANFTPQMVLEMCIFSGCDYLASLMGMGLKRAYALVKKFRDYRKIIKHLKFSGVQIPDSYEEDFQHALLTFRHQLVYDPIKRQAVHLHDLPSDVNLPECLDFVGPSLSAELAQRIASGIVDPITHTSFDSKDYMPPTGKVSEDNSGMNATPPVQQGAIFTGAKRKRERESPASPAQKNIITKYFSLKTTAAAKQDFQPPRTTSSPADFDVSLYPVNKLKCLPSSNGAFTNGGTFRTSPSKSNPFKKADDWTIFRCHNSDFPDERGGCFSSRQFWEELASVACSPEKRLQARKFSEDACLRQEGERWQIQCQKIRRASSDANDLDRLFPVKDLDECQDRQLGSSVLQIIPARPTAAWRTQDDNLDARFPVHASFQRPCLDKKMGGDCNEAKDPDSSCLFSDVREGMNIVGSSVGSISARLVGVEDSESLESRFCERSMPGEAPNGDAYPSDKGQGTNGRNGHRHNAMAVADAVPVAGAHEERGGLAGGADRPLLEKSSAKGMTTDENRQAGGKGQGTNGRNGHRHNATAVADAVPVAGAHEERRGLAGGADRPLLEKSSAKGMTTDENRQPGSNEHAEGRERILENNQEEKEGHSASNGSKEEVYSIQNPQRRLSDISDSCVRGVSIRGLSNSTCNGRTSTLKSTGALTRQSSFWQNGKSRETIEGPEEKEAHTPSKAKEDEKGVEAPPEGEKISQGYDSGKVYNNDLTLRNDASEPSQEKRTEEPKHRGRQMGEKESALSATVDGPLLDLSHIKQHKNDMDKVLDKAVSSLDRFRCNRMRGTRASGLRPVQGHQKPSRQVCGLGVGAANTNTRRRASVDRGVVGSTLRKPAGG